MNRLSNEALRSGDVPRPLWPSDNGLGIPTLLLDLQAGVLDPPFCRWGRERRKSRMRGTWHFYTDDSRFNALWSRPQDLLNSGCVAAVEPNFSIADHDPPAVAHWQIYRKRYLARVWQEHGVRVLVDLYVPRRYAEVNLAGVPRGWRSYATRGEAGNLEGAIEEWQRAVEWAANYDILFMVYGGGRELERAAREHGWLWAPDERSEVCRG